MPCVLDLLVVQLSPVAAAKQQCRHVRRREVGAALAERGHLRPGDRVIREKDGCDAGRDRDRSTGSHGVCDASSRSGRERGVAVLLPILGRRWRAHSPGSTTWGSRSPTSTSLSPRTSGSPGRRPSHRQVGRVRRHRGGDVRGGRARASSCSAAPGRNRRSPASWPSGAAGSTTSPIGSRTSRRASITSPSSGCNCSTRARAGAPQAGSWHFSTRRRRAGVLTELCQPDQETAGSHA